jgi:drug/metabolite transporter (DMT)-like permease
MDFGQSRSNSSGFNGASNGNGTHHHDADQLHQTAARLSQEIAHLQTAKEQLENEVDSLKDQYRSLQQVVQQSAEVRRHRLATKAPELAGISVQPLLVQLQQGVGLVLVSVVALALHNVVIHKLLGVANGFMPASLGNALLLLWTRMLVVVPLMMFWAKVLHPPVWHDLEHLLRDRDRKPLGTILLSGGLLFVSQVLIYLAIAQLTPGPAVALLFMYPLVTLPATWWLFGDRRTVLQFGALLIVLLGAILTAGAMGGWALAAGASVAFAGYLLLQLGFKKLHPVPVSLVQFVTMLVLSSVGLLLPLQVTIPPSSRLALGLGGLVLGGLTLVGYLTNHFGVRAMGAARAGVLASSLPILTAVIAAIVLQVPLAQLQIVGILLVTVGGAALSLERLKQIQLAQK